MKRETAPNSGWRIILAGTHAAESADCRPDVSNVVARRNDRTKYEITYTDGKELFAWPGERQFRDRSFLGALGSGVTSSGEFAQLGKAVFLDSFTTTRYVGPDALNSRPALRWDFRIPLFGSGWRVTYAGATAKISSHGSFWADPKNLEVLRIEFHGDDLPVFYSAVYTAVDYGRVKLGDRDVLLPRAAVLDLHDWHGKQNRNTIEYTNCRQYVGESTVSFDK